MIPFETIAILLLLMFMPQILLLIDGVEISVDKSLKISTGKLSRKPDGPDIGISAVDHCVR